MSAMTGNFKQKTKRLLQWQYDNLHQPSIYLAGHVYMSPYSDVTIVLCFSTNFSKR